MESLNIEWSNLPFGYHKTDYNTRVYFRNGQWGKVEISSDENVNIHMASTSLHYGQQAFEGLKAFKGKDGKVRIFRWEENAKRLRRSCEGILMQSVPDELFKEMVFTAVKMNERFIPPYGTGASLYIRPVLFGIGPEVGVKPAKDYLFVVFVCPVGPYFKTGFKPTKIAIERQTDRAAPLGTGNIKVGGNYAASLKGVKRVASLGYGSALYLDSKEKKYIDEIGAANFFGIKDGKYITPLSPSVLPSITNMSLLEIAEKIGLKTERRAIPIEELDSFDEVGACGTAAIIAPIGQIDDLDNNKTYYYCKDGNAGNYCTKLYETLLGIQYGDIEDSFGWVSIIE